MQEINTEIYLKKKNKKREYGRNRYLNMSEKKLIVKLIKAESLYSIKKSMHTYIHNKLLILLIIFLISICTVLAQEYSFRDAFIAFNDTLLFLV